MTRPLGVTSQVWTALPRGFEAATLVVSLERVIVGGAEGKRVTASITDDGMLDFVPVHFPEGFEYGKWTRWEVPVDELERFSGTCGIKVSLS